MKQLVFLLVAALLAMGCAEETEGEVSGTEAASTLEGGEEGGEQILNPDIVEWNTVDTVENPAPDTTEETLDASLEDTTEPEDEEDIEASTDAEEDGGVEEPEIPALAIKISEVMYNPDAVDDNAGEWFELYNAGSDPVDLRDLEISDDSEEFKAIEGDNPLLLAPGQYAALGNNSDVTLNGDYIPVAEFSFQMGNGGDTIIVRLDGVELDRINYGDYDSAKGVSLQQSPDTLMDTTLSGAEGLWCLASTPFGDGDLGTPGAENVQCESSAETSGGEEEGGEEYGDPSALMITEFMPNPAAVEDGLGEWIEITNTGAAAINLKGLKLADAAGEQTITADVIVPGDNSALLARSKDSALNGGMDNVAYVISSIQLNNGNDSIILLDETGAELDRIDYDEDAGWSFDSGVAVQLEAALAAGPGGNNDPASWCAASAPYGAGDLGTPGFFNPPCGTGGEGSQGGEEGGETGEGNATGKVYVNEIMAENSNGESWIELFHSGTQDLDLSGWSLVDDGGSEMVLPSGITISGPGYLYLEKGDGNSSDAPTFGFELNSNDTVFLKGPLGEMVDILNWENGDAPADKAFGRYPDGADASGTLSAPTPNAPNVDFAAGSEPVVTDHICDNECGATYVGEIECFCDSLCFVYGDCCNAEGTQYAAGCSGSTCSECQPPATCCTAGEGCGNNSCETCVCATQPSCCAGVWDAACSALANEACGTECGCQ